MREGAAEDPKRASLRIHAWHMLAPRWGMQSVVYGWAYVEWAHGDPPSTRARAHLAGRVCERKEATSLENLALDFQSRSDSHPAPSSPNCN